MARLERSDHDSVEPPAHSSLTSPQEPSPPSSGAAAPSGDHGGRETNLEGKKNKGTGERERERERGREGGRGRRDEEETKKRGKRDEKETKKRRRREEEQKQTV